MEDVKIYGHLTSGISDSNSPYSNGDNWIAEAHYICDKDFKDLSEEIIEGSLPIERQDLINRYLYNKEVNSTANLTEALSQEALERKSNDALLNADISAVNGRLSSQINGIQDKLNNYKLYSIVTSLPTSNIDKNKIYIIASEEGVENNIYTEYIYTDENTWEKLGEFKADIDLDQYVKKTDESNVKSENLPTWVLGRPGESDYLSVVPVNPEGLNGEFRLAEHLINLKTGEYKVKNSDVFKILVADDTRNGLMSSLDKIKLNRIPNPIINNINSEVSFSEILSGKVIEINYTTKDLNTNVENSRAIYIPTVNSEHIGLMSVGDKEKLDNVVRDIEPIVFTLGGLSSIFDDPWSIIPMVGQTKTLTDEELQKSNLINLYKILDSNNPIIINIQGVDAKHYYIKEKFGDELSGYGIVMLIENKELKIEYSTFTSSNPDGGVSLIQQTTISSKYIHQHADDSSVNSLEYCLIKKLDYDDILRRLSALESGSTQTE